LKFNDAVTGAGLIALGAVILWHVQGFPPMPGQKYGPAVFPGLIAAGLVVCGAMLAVQGVRADMPWIALGGWMRRPRSLAAFLSVIAGLALYVLAVDALGFHITGFALLAGWTLILGVRPRTALAVSMIAPIVIHLAFYKLLRIPLPWGVLERFAF
jgi:putative tricarboxylic transport membrane protein